MGEQSIVPDTSLLLYLGRIGKVDVLPFLYKEVCAPEKVVLYWSLRVLKVFA